MEGWNHTAEEQKLAQLMKHFQIQPDFLERMVNVSYIGSNNTPTATSTNSVNIHNDRRMLRATKFIKSFFAERLKPTVLSIFKSEGEIELAPVDVITSYNYSTEEAVVKLISEYNMDEYRRKVSHKQVVLRLNS